jgi:hypothetical protein
MSQFRDEIQLSLCVQAQLMSRADPMRVLLMREEATLCPRESVRFKGSSIRDDTNRNYATVYIVPLGRRRPMQKRISAPQPSQNRVVQVDHLCRISLATRPTRTDMAEIY